MLDLLFMVIRLSLNARVAGRGSQSKLHQFMQATSDPRHTSVARSTTSFSFRRHGTTRPDRTTAVRIRQCEQMLHPQHVKHEISTLPSRYHIDSNCATGSSCLLSAMKPNDDNTTHSWYVSTLLKLTCR